MAWLAFAWVVHTAPARADAAEVVIEIDAGAERVLDARAARRLVALELADVEVPSSANGLAPALFYRVLGGAGGLVRVELWERGELHDARVVSTANGSGHLLARRVALAAAELARGLRQKRRAQQRRAARELERRRAEARALAERTLEGPFALRSALALRRGDDVSLLGAGLGMELTLHRRLRLDLGLRQLGGLGDALPRADDESRARFSMLEAFVGPAHRFPLTPRLDLDVSAELAASLVHVGGATAVDAIPSVRETWTARGAVGVRLQPCLSRSIRASFGAEAALQLRTIRAEFPGSLEERYRGFVFGGEIGVVITPE